MFWYQPIDAVDLLAAEAVTVLKPDGLEPELGLAIVALNVDILRETRRSSAPVV
jgi:hypothetical protein